MILLAMKEFPKSPNGKLTADLAINCVNIRTTELYPFGSCRERDFLYFFSMATSFTEPALGAGRVSAKNIDMIIGNGYMKDHAEINALNILREYEKIKKLYEALYC